MAVALQQRKDSEEELVIIPIFGREAEIAELAEAHPAYLPGISSLWPGSFMLDPGFNFLPFSTGPVKYPVSVDFVSYGTNFPQVLVQVLFLQTYSNRNMKEKRKAFINPTLITNIKLY